MAQASEVRVPTSEQTRERLFEAKQHGETYNDVLQRLLNRYEENKDENGR